MWRRRILFSFAFKCGGTDSFFPTWRSCSRISLFKPIKFSAELENRSNISLTVLIWRILPLCLFEWYECRGQPYTVQVVVSTTRNRKSNEAVSRLNVTAANEWINVDGRSRNDRRDRCWLPSKNDWREYCTGTKCSSTCHATTCLIAHFLKHSKA